MYFFIIGLHSISRFISVFVDQHICFPGMERDNCLIAPMMSSSPFLSVLSWLSHMLFLDIVQTITVDRLLSGRVRHLAGHQN